MCFGGLRDRQRLPKKSDLPSTDAGSSCNFRWLNDDEKLVRMHHIKRQKVTQEKTLCRRDEKIELLQKKLADARAMSPVVNTQDDDDFTTMMNQLACRASVNACLTCCRAR